jgi:hypothetical protein
MRPTLRFLAIAVIGMTCLVLTDHSRASTQPFGRSTRSHMSTRIPGFHPSRMGTYSRQYTSVNGQITRRTSGQRAYVVQTRLGRSGKTAVMPTQEALMVRTKMRSQGISAHLHNYPQGSLVHFNAGQWRSQAMFNNSQAANQIAAKFRARGISARVITR